jgi:lipoate-protein ligase A
VEERLIREQLRGELACVDLTLPSSAEDLALDEALLIEADAGRGRRVLRFWEPAGQAVVLGASCRVADDVDVDACRTDGVPVLRRTSGGGTVVVGPGTLNVTVILPDTAAPGLSAVDVAHGYVMDWIARSIRQAGPAVALAGRGDLVIGDRKCAGSAQRRMKGWFMVHCSILYDFSIERIGRYLAIPRRQPDYRQGRSHHEFLSNVGLTRTILVDALRGDRVAATAAELAPTLALVPGLMSEKFANRAWIDRF